MKKIFSLFVFMVTLAVAVYAAVTSVEVADPAMQLATLSLIPAVTRDPGNGQPIPVFTRAQKALFEFLERKAQGQTRAALASGALIFDPITYYIRFNITGRSGKQKIVDQTTQRQVGVSNFDKGYLPQYYNFCFDRITVRYAASNTPANPTVQAMNGYSSVLSSMDPALRNGELIISSNKSIILESPVIDFGSVAAPTGGGARDFDGGMLQTPRILEENKLVEIELSFAGTIPSAANTTYAVEVALQGVQARINN